MEVRTIPFVPLRLREALAHTNREDWARRGRPDFASWGSSLRLSIPSLRKCTMRVIHKHECMATANALRARLNLDDDQLLVTFQSVLGPQKWLGAERPSIPSPSLLVAGPVS